MDIKKTSLISFACICLSSVLWLILITNLFSGLVEWLNHIFVFFRDIGLILFSMGILSRFKSAKVQSIILIIASGFNLLFEFIDGFEFYFSTFLFGFLTFYGPILLLLVILLNHNEVKQIKNKIIIAIVGLAVGLVVSLFWHILYQKGIDSGEYAQFLYWNPILVYPRFIFVNGGLLLATGSFINFKDSSTLQKVNDNKLKNDTSKYQPMSIGNWIVTYLIMIIPIVNIVMLFVWGFGDNTQPSKANWAKATLIWFSIFIVLYLVFFVAIIGSSF